MKEGLTDTQPTTAPHDRGCPEVFCSPRLRRGAGGEVETQSPNLWALSLWHSSRGAVMQFNK